MGDRSGDGSDGLSPESNPIHHLIIHHPFNRVFTQFFGSGESGVRRIWVKFPSISTCRHGMSQINKKVVLSSLNLLKIL